ncbi:DEAD/DEAH box helicase [Candidatus Thorarchaeota archaeon]|nr:MAG: DEAD/DEAH box helicase [Candidatus Thorarchaeota archaeon]
MPVLHCAKCGSKLDFNKVAGGWYVNCPGCDVEILVDGSRKDLFDAYDEYTKEINRLATSLDSAKTHVRKDKYLARGSDTPKKKRRVKDAHQRVQSEKAIKDSIEEGGGELDTLPPPLQNLVLSGRDFLVKYKFMDATDADYGAKVSKLGIPTRLKELFESKGITDLYRFQEDAYNAINSGEDVVIVAPTAQGKTEGFILPIIRQLLISVQESFVTPGIRALLIYPTKALARDQYEKVNQIGKAAGVSVAIFDGDVSQNERSIIYSRPPDILLTNPDVLHYHLGWSESRLVPLLSTVKFVVLDEIHLYTGSMGTNVYYILKRLEMESGRYQKIGASATVANPKEFATLLFDTDVKLIESTSAKRGPVHFLMYYPGMRSKYSMIVDLVTSLQSCDFKTLVFGNTHSEAEVLNMLISDTGVKSMVHRAGLSKKYRSGVEDEFKSGKLPVIVSTPTLELGIDIGDLNSVVSMIVSITRLTQRIGRAGRKGQESVAILALRENDPISAFYKHEPEKYFTDIDAAYMEPDNEVVGYYQLIAAAFTGNLRMSQFVRHRQVIEKLVEDGLVKITDADTVRIIDADRARKAWRDYSIRGIGDTVQIRLDRKGIGERSMPMAAQELHPGAVYLHGGKNYQSVDFKYTKGLGRATVVPHHERGIHTKPLYYTMPKIIEIINRSKILGLNAIYCTLEMTQTVEGYVKKNTRTGQVLSRSMLPNTLTYTYQTRGFAFTSPEPLNSVNDYLSGKFASLGSSKMNPATLYGGAFHAVEHVLIESSDMLTGGGTREIGGVSMGDSGIIFVYDGSPGGNGASRLLFGKLDEAFRRSKTILENCDCTTIDGCPLCTYSYHCGNNNNPLFKIGALESVSLILSNAETNVDTEGYTGYQPLV